VGPWNFVFLLGTHILQLKRRKRYRSCLLGPPGSTTVSDGWGGIVISTPKSVEWRKNTVRPPRVCRVTGRPLPRPLQQPPPPPFSPPRPARLLHPATAPSAPPRRRPRPLHCASALHRRALLLFPPFLCPPPRRTPSTGAAATSSGLRPCLAAAPIERVEGYIRWGRPQVGARWLCGRSGGVPA
jgi:hypothetical protein